MAILINPTNLSAKEAADLCVYILEKEPQFLDRKNVHHASIDTNNDFQLTHNLILDKSSLTSDEKKYFVISNDPVDELGEGAFSKTRRIIGSIEVNPTKQFLSYTPVTDKAVKITNTKQAQIRDKDLKQSYKHKTAVQAYKDSLPFTHLSMQEPIKRQPYTGSGGFFFNKKSYTVMNELPGQNLNDATIDFIQQNTPNTQVMIKSVILPLLEEYKKQIADKNYVHRDIKPGNINAVLTMNGSQINFLDFDSCKPLGEKDDAFGSPAYIAPESILVEGLTISSARDIFSLGVLLTACINPELEPTRYIRDEHQIDNTSAAFEFAFTEVSTNLSYDADKMVRLNGENYDLFQYMDDSNILDQVREDTYSQIKELLKKMTSFDPATRPSLDEIITKFKKLEQDLDQQAQIARTLSR